VALEPGTIKPFEAPVTEISTITGVNAGYHTIMKRFLQLVEDEKPAGYLNSTAGEVFNPADGEERSEQVWCGWTSKEAHLNAKGKSAERNEFIKELSLASSGKKPETIHVSFKEI